jgi:tetratricopeptide (TPR) repeat protein
VKVWKVFIQNIPDLKHYALSLLLAGVVVCLCSAFARADNDFQERFKAYQAEVNTGRSALDKKEYESAIRHYSKAIEMSPFEAMQYFNRGVAFYKSGKMKEAEEDFSRAIILDPRQAVAYSYRGLVKMKGGDQEGALKDYSAALGLNPRDPSVHNNLAWLYATANDEKLQDKVKAIEHAVRAVEMTKEKNAEALDTLARAYFINGKKAEAIETEKKAIELELNNKELKENLSFYERDSKKQ